MNLISSILNKDAAEYFLETFAEVFGYQSVYNWVDTRVGVSHAVREQPEGISGLVEREVSVQIA